MATSLPTADRTTDTLSKLRIQRAEPRRSGSWFGTLLKVCFVLGALAGVALGGFYLADKQGWISSKKSWLAIPDLMQSRPEVRLAKVTVQSGRSADATVVATGYLESRRQARIGARAPGRVEQLHVEEGTRVKAGEVLAVLEHKDLDASMAAAQATLARSKAAADEQAILIQQYRREFERAEQLWKNRTISELEYDTARFKSDGAAARGASLASEIALAEARVAEAEQMQANMFIRAPFDGTVISKDAEVGESILPGGMGEASGRGSAVTVADLDHLEVDCDVKEDYIGRIVPGLAAEAAVDAVPGHRYQGRVRKIIPMGNRARATIKVKVEIVDVDERLFPNMSATVYFLPAETGPAVAETTRRVFCDSAAIQSDESGDFVWIADEQDRLQRLDVETGGERDGRTEITKGVAGSERVVITPAGIEAGQLVKVNR